MMPSYGLRFLLLLERDLRIFFNDKLSILLMFVNFSIDLFVSGLTFSRMITGFNYLLFVAPGANLITAAFVAFQSGREIFVERALRELSPYHLTLPVPRYLYVFARMTSGVTKSVIATTPGTIVILALHQQANPTGIVGAFAIIALFALGAAALSIVAAISTRRTEVFITIRSAAQLYLSLLTTVFYPHEFVPPFLAPLALLNPKTWAVQATRQLLQGTSFPLLELTLLASTSLLLAFLAAWIYVRLTRM
jgi:ABC-2 type transport system permease protein